MVIKSIADLKKKENANRRRREQRCGKLHSDGNNYTFGEHGQMKRPDMPDFVGKLRCPSCKEIIYVNKRRGQQFTCKCGATFCLEGAVLKQGAI